MRLKSADEEALRDLGATAVYLFGSQAEGLDHPLSDLDIGIVLAEPQKLGGDKSDLYNAFYSLFGEIFPDRSLDIVFLQSVGLELAFDALNHGQVLFESSLEERLRYEESIALLYAG